MIPPISQRPSKLTLGLIHAYQATLSPDKGPLRHRLGGRICQHEPHCSEYARLCFERYGFIQALHMSIERVSHCTGSHQKIQDPPYYRVVFCSGSPLGVPFLEKLADDKRFDLVGVIAPEAKKSGRGMKLQDNINVQIARKFLTEDDIHTPRSLRLTSKKYTADAQQIRDRLDAKEIDFLVVVAYGKIIPEDILNIPQIGPINVHGSILPAYRGASPLQSVFLDKLDESGITIMRMDPTLDTGDMLAVQTTSLDHQRTVNEFIERIKDNSPQFLNDTMRKRGKGRIEPVPQDTTKATYCTKINKEDGLITDNDTLAEVYAKRKAYAMWPKIYMIHEGKRVIIEHLTVDKETLLLNGKTPWRDGTTLHSAISQCKVKPEGKKVMERDEFVKGYMSK